MDGLGAAEIAWEEARDGGARANVRIRWTGGGRAGAGRAGAAEIAWEEANVRAGAPVDGRMDGLNGRANVRIRWTGGAEMDGHGRQK